MPDEWTITASSVLAAILALVLMSLIVYGFYAWTRTGTPIRLLLALARKPPKHRAAIAVSAGLVATVVSLTGGILTGVAHPWLWARALPPGVVFGLGLWFVPPRLQRHLDEQE